MGEHWIKGGLLLLDTETDDSESTRAQLIQVALIHLVAGKQQYEKTWLVQPRRPIPAEATGVHEITMERAQAEGLPVEQVLSELSEALERDWPGAVLVGSNVNYDLTVRDREHGRVLGDEPAILGPVVDTLLLDKRVDRFRAGSRKLKDQCEHYGLPPLDDAHDAAADARAAGRVLWAIVVWCVKNQWPWGRYGPHATERHARMVVANPDPVPLYDAQRHWHEEGQLGLAEYWRSPKAIEKTREKLRRGELTEAECEALIAKLPAMADGAEATARGCWPVIPRSLVVA